MKNQPALSRGKFRHLSGPVNRRGARRETRWGTSIVEFALVVPVILAILIGILESAYLTKNYLSIANASREGARAASLGKTTTDIRTRVKNAATPVSVPDANIILQYSTDNGATYPYTLGDSGTANSATGGSLVRVTVRYTHQSLTRFFPFLSNRTLSVPVTMRREAT